MNTTWTWVAIVVVIIVALGLWWQYGMDGANTMTPEEASQAIQSSDNSDESLNHDLGITNEQIVQLGAEAAVAADSADGAQ